MHAYAHADQPEASTRRQTTGTAMSSGFTGGHGQANTAFSVSPILNQFEALKQQLDNTVAERDGFQEETLRLREISKAQKCVFPSMRSFDDPDVFT